jgi:hypothetical protein
MTLYGPGDALTLRSGLVGRVLCRQRLPALGIMPIAADDRHLPNAQAPHIVKC